MTVKKSENRSYKLGDEKAVESARPEPFGAFYVIK
jgi:hypothetical protein